MASSPTGTEDIQVTPERLCTSDFMSLLKHLYEKGRINRLVVDEVSILRSDRSPVDALSRHIAFPYAL